MSLLFVDTSPQIDVRGDHAVVTLASGKDEHQFILTRNAFAKLIEGGRREMAGLFAHAPEPITLPAKPRARRA